MTVPSYGFQLSETSLGRLAYGASSRPGSGTETIMLTPDHKPLKSFLGSTYNY